VGCGYPTRAIGSLLPRTDGPIGAPQLVPAALFKLSEVDAMNPRLLTIAGLTALLLCTAVAPAAAQTTYITPFAGATFEGDAPESQLSTGVSLAWMGDYAGFELELGYTPDFFAEDPDLVLVGDSNVTSLMANLMLGYAPDEIPVQPYAAIGLGLLRSRIEGGDLFEDVSENDLGFNIGAGLFGMITEHVGLRGEVRYFRGFRGDDGDDVEVAVSDFDFWRAYGGVTFGF
jgi:opacity protein-like surface antigen